MNKTLVALAVTRMAVAAIMAGGGVWLAIEGRPGWGWFLFVSLLIGASTYEEN